MGWLVGLGLGRALGASGTHVLRVRDFGAVPGDALDAGPALRAAFQAAVDQGPGVEVRLEAGTYRVRPAVPRSTCLPIRRARNLTLRGAGSQTRIVVDDPQAGGIELAESEGVEVRDLTLDYDPVPFTQGLIRGIDVAGGTFDLEMAAGYPLPDGQAFVEALEPYGKWGMVMDPQARRIRPGTPDHLMTPRWERVGDRLFRFRVGSEHYRRGLETMRSGDAYVHLARGNACAVLVHRCRDVLLSGLTLHASPGLAIGLVANQGTLRVSEVSVRFAPGTDRLLTANADGVHCQQNRGQLVIERCYFEGMADDAINIYAPPSVLRSVRSATQWLVNGGAPVQAGDRLQVLDPGSGSVRGIVHVARCAPEVGGVAVDLVEPLAGVRSGEDHRSGDTLYNLDACGAGFVIRGNHMKGHRRYGCLLRAGGGVVEDNTFEDTTGAGVVLANEPDWPEGPVPWGITVRRNRFVRGGTCQGYADSTDGAALVIRGTRLGHGLAEGEPIRDLLIEANEFVDRPGVSMFLGGARQVVLRSNRIRGDARSGLRQAGPGIRVERCSGVVIEDTVVQDERMGSAAALEIGALVGTGDAGLRVKGLEVKLPPGANPVMDHRR